MAPSSLASIKRWLCVRRAKRSKLAAVARGGDDEAAVRFQRRIEVAPQRDALAAELAQHRRRRLGLALGRQHDGRIEARRIGERLGARLDKAHAMAGAGKRERLPEAENSGAEHRDGARVGGHASSVGCAGSPTVRTLQRRSRQSPSAAPSRRASAAPSRCPSRRVTMWMPEFISDGTMRCPSGLKRQRQRHRGPVELDLEAATLAAEVGEVGAPSARRGPSRAAR